MTDTFPRQYARTQRLTLGEPRSLQVTRDGSAVWFARSTAGDDPVNRLWIADPSTGEEREAWWRRGVEVFPTYEEYKAKTDREIPVFVARPV